MFEGLVSMFEGTDRAEEVAVYDVQNIATEELADAAEIIVRQPVRLVGLRAVVEPHALHRVPLRILPVVGSALQRLGLRRGGPAICLFRPCDDGRFEVTTGYPGQRNLTMGSPFVRDRIPGGIAAQVVHPGSWDTVLGSYDRLSEWLTTRRVSSVPLMWEEYLVGPDQTRDAEQWRTRIGVPLPQSAPVRSGRA